MKGNKLFVNLLNIFMSAMLVFAIMLVSINAALDFKPLYYFDVVNLDLQNVSDMTVSEIRNNYNYVIDYVNGKTNTDFQLPTLPSSATGRIHFYEVRKLFQLSKYAIVVLLIIYIFMFYAFRRYKNKKFLKWSGLTLLFLPYGLLIIMSSNFDKYFKFIHHLLFNNNYWLLDPAEDPIIDLLPETFFFHCIVLILLLTNIIGILLYSIYRTHKD